MLFYRFCAAQPVLLAFVDCDAREAHELVDLARTFDRSVLGFVEHSGKIGLEKLGAYGIMVFVFSDGSSAHEFNRAHKKKCKLFHFWKKTRVYGWVADLEAEVLQRHPGLPLFMVLNPKKLARAVFGESGDAGY